MGNAESTLTAPSEDRPETLSGQVVWVTGATRGIGRAIATVLAEAGSRIVCTYLASSGAARQVQKELESHGADVWCIQQDVCDFDGTRRVFEGIMQRYGRLDALVNNAGVTADSPLYLMEPDQWHRVLQTNLTGVFNSCRVAITSMMKQGSGRIVNVASVAGLIGVAGQTNYCASKAGIVGFSRALAKEASQFHVTVNVVAPGYIDTEMTAQLPEAKRQSIMKQIPLKRMGTVYEVAAVVRFLLSGECRYITGQVIPVDGGLTA